MKSEQEKAIIAKCEARGADAVRNYLITGRWTGRNAVFAKAWLENYERGSEESSRTEQIAFAREANALAREANDVARASNDIASAANLLAERANRYAKAAASAAAIAVIVSIAAIIVPRLLGGE